MQRAAAPCLESNAAGFHEEAGRPLDAPASGICDPSAPTFLIWQLAEFDVTVGPTRMFGGAAKPPGGGAPDWGLLANGAEALAFVDVWRGSVASDLPIIGTGAVREAALKLRAKAVLPEMERLGLTDVGRVVLQAKHLEVILGGLRVHNPPARQSPPAAVHLMPPDVLCAECGSDRLETSAMSATLRVHGVDGTSTGTAYKKVCLARGCGCVHYYNEIQPVDGPGRYRGDFLEQPYQRATQRTAYTREVMNFTTALLERCQVSFDGITAALRSEHREDDGRLDRIERQKLTAAWFARDAVAACKEIGVEVPPPRELRWASISETLRELLPAVRQHYRETNLLSHDRRCTRPGECNTAVLDGIWLRTFKCKTDFKHYKIMPGGAQVHLGCTNAPAPGAAYCHECLRLGGLRIDEEEADASDAQDVAAAITAEAGATPAAAASGGEGSALPPRRQLRASTMKQREAFQAYHAGLEQEAGGSRKRASSGAPPPRPKRPARSAVPADADADVTETSWRRPASKRTRSRRAGWKWERAIMSRSRRTCTSWRSCRTPRRRTSGCASPRPEHEPPRPSVSSSVCPPAAARRSRWCSSSGSAGNIRRGSRARTSRPPFSPSTTPAGRTARRRFRRCSVTPPSPSSR